MIFVSTQNQQNYYILEEEGYSIAPIQKNINQDGTLALTFSDTALQNYFQGKTVYKYDLGFPTTNTGYLSRVYEVTILGENLESQLTVNAFGYSQGLYTVTLIANGVVIESKNLVKN